MAKHSGTVACKHHNQRLLREVTVILKKRKLSTGVRISGGKDFTLVPATNLLTYNYNWLIHCADCLEVLQGEQKDVPSKNK